MQAIVQPSFQRNEKAPWQSLDDSPVIRRVKAQASILNPRGAKSLGPALLDDLFIGIADDEGDGVATDALNSMCMHIRERVSTRIATKAYRCER